MRDQRHSKAELDLAGDLRDRGKHRLATGHVRMAFAEMMLHTPHRVEPHTVGEDDLFEVITI